MALARLKINEHAPTGAAASSALISSLNHAYTYYYLLPEV
jgi:hypothetical protein